MDLDILGNAVFTSTTYALSEILCATQQHSMYHTEAVW